MSFSLHTFPFQFLHGGTGSCPSPSSGSRQNCCHPGILEGHSSGQGGYCVPEDDSGCFQIQPPHQSSYNQDVPPFFFSLIGWNDGAG